MQVSALLDETVHSWFTRMEEQALSGLPYGRFRDYVAPYEVTGFARRRVAALPEWFPPKREASIPIFSYKCGLFGRMVRQP